MASLFDLFQSYGPSGSVQTSHAEGTYLLHNLPGGFVYPVDQVRADLASRGYIAEFRDLVGGKTAVQILGMNPAPTVAATNQFNVVSIVPESQIASPESNLTPLNAPTSGTTTTAPPALGFLGFGLLAAAAFLFFWRR